METTTNKLQMFRVAIAFIVAPVIVPIGLEIAGYVMGEDTFRGFYIGIGSVVGYFFAITIGIPAYITDLRHKKNRLGFSQVCLKYTLVCSVVFFALWGLMFVVQDGVLGLLSPAFLGYGLIFTICAAVSISVFYLIAFYEIKKHQPID